MIARYRRGRPADADVAHATANVLIAAHAPAMGSRWLWT